MHGVSLCPSQRAQLSAKQCKAATASLPACWRRVGEGLGPVHVCMCACRLMRMYVCMYACMHVHTHVHTRGGRSRGMRPSGGR